MIIYSRSGGGEYDEDKGSAVRPEAQERHTSLNNSVI
jgi:hypothetical protein